jgi:hypothetical protein
MPFGGARYKPCVPICIAGMPHSGLSLVSRLLGRVGLDLGPAGDDLQSPGGAGRFAKLNEEILEAVGAAWNAPPPRGGHWARTAQLEPFRRRAAGWADALGLSEPWGWADPRNSLTLPFWKDLFPDLLLVVCVRDPREVTVALKEAGEASAKEAVDLWEQYYGALLDFAGDTPVITLLESYWRDPTAELGRLAWALGLDASRVTVAWTAAGADLASRQVGAADGPLPRRVEDLYERLRTGAALPPSTPSVNRGRREPSPPAADDLPEVLEAQRRELEHLRLELARVRGYNEALRAQVEVRSTEPDDLREVALSLEQQLLERDEELERLGQELRAGDTWRHETQAMLTRGVETLREELELIKSTRLWRAGQSYWTLKERLRRALRRGPS